MDWGALLGGLDKAGWIGWVVVLVFLYRQSQTDSVRVYQAALHDMGEQIKALRTQRDQDRQDHIREIESIHLGHQREYELERGHRLRCERDYERLRDALRVIGIDPDDPSNRR